MPMVILLRTKDTLPQYHLLGGYLLETISKGKYYSNISVIKDVIK